MALQWEIVKSVVVAILALLRASGGPSLPTASIVALLVLQTLSCFGALLTPPPKKIGKEDVSPVATAASVAAKAATSFATSFSSTWQVTSLSRVVLAVLFARALRVMGFGNSFAQVAILALFGGCLCHRLACSSRRVYERGCCSHDPEFWQPLDLTAAEEDHKSPLADLVQEYYGPRSMLSEVTENIDSVSSTATSRTATSVPASVAFSGVASRTNKQHIIGFVLIVLLARALHFMGLCNSLAQVALLAGLGGGICYCICTVPAQVELSDRELSEETTIWPNVATMQTEEQEHTTPLASLAAEYIACGMLEYTPCFECVC